MNLYQPNPLLDSQFAPPDLEWLYRQQDVDGAQLTSRLAQLAPISFSNVTDGQRRRRLFELHSWDTNNFVWAIDNPAAPGSPGGTFPTNSRFGATGSASFSSLGYATPTLAHRDKKINLNYPLPVSNDPNEAVRQKWITDTYYMLKAILPPRAVDTPEELVQLSQYVINMVDFRDPDCTMTHWVNPDVLLVNVQTGAAAPTATTPVPTLMFTAAVPAGGTVGTLQFDQWGMEYNPVAINEVLAYSYQYWGLPPGGGGAGATPGQNRINRFFCELVNTLNSPELNSTIFPAGGPYMWNPGLSLGGFQSWQSDAVSKLPDPYASGCWDVVFTTDDPYSRPDPYRGQLMPFGNSFGLTPLSHTSFDNTLVATGTAGTSASGTVSDVVLTPLGYPPSASVNGIPAPTAANNYYYAIGNQDPDPNPNSNLVDDDPTPTQFWHDYQTAISAAASGYNTPPITAPTLFQTFSTAMDPINGTNSTTVATTSPVPLWPGVLPAGITTTTALPPNYSPYLNANASYRGNFNATVVSNPFTAATTGGGAYYWMCLRRPANPFAPVSAANPMVVVDSMRFPFIEGTAPLTGAGPGGAALRRPCLSCCHSPRPAPATAPRPPPRLRRPRSISRRRPPARHRLLGPALPALSGRSRRTEPE